MSVHARRYGSKTLMPLSVILQTYKSRNRVDFSTVRASALTSEPPPPPPVRPPQLVVKPATTEVGQHSILLLLRERAISCTKAVNHEKRWTEQKRSKLVFIWRVCERAFVDIWYKHFVIALFGLWQTLKRRPQLSANLILFYSRKINKRWKQQQQHTLVMKDHKHVVTTMPPPPRSDVTDDVAKKVTNWTRTA